ncbi:deleted in malignant brain tumors 1 protein-like [Patiria miniata]|uniref:SRCR domain-containing protein n=1 Tax=Patiria miniata TaxID=46514 RepID=A0A914B0F1_PATMI|nr:deleted in malignant brain tumors 1 protein-like [Patiria miniata]
MKILMLMAVLITLIVGTWGRLKDYDVRLVQGHLITRGRVEVYMNGSWATVCGNDWDMNDAIVVCQQLGFGMAASAPGGAYFGEGKGRILDVDCTGLESNLSGCSVTFNNVSSCNHSQDAGVVCQGPKLPSQYDLRLVNGSTGVSGRVEVYVDESWGTICDHGWDIQDATVVCQQLGYGMASAAESNAHFGQGSGDIVFDDVACTGTETHLYGCPLDMNKDCSHSEDAGVICTGKPGIRNFEGQIRLVNGTDNLQGRVEVYVNETWGTVCGSGWDINDATVVCSQLGYGKAVSAYAGQGNEDVALDGVSCAGLESSLLECPRNSNVSCTQSTTAWVTCALPEKFDLRLRNGSSHMEGRVEMYLNDAWGTVCDDGWDMTDATVACWQLGYGKATSAPGSAFFGQGSGDIVLGNVDCKGTEKQLGLCKGQESDAPVCLHYRDAGVVCSQPDEYDIRLIDGSNTMEGRVEVYVNGSWGTVCDNQWGMNNGEVVCRQLGFQSVTAAPWSAYFGQGSGDVVLDKVACKGTESSLQYCPKQRNTTCKHWQDASVVCSNDPTEEYDVSLSNLVPDDSVPQGTVEVYVNGVWGTICDDGWDINDASVICRQLGYVKASSAPGSAFFGQGSGEIVLHNVNCTGIENNLRDCPSETTNNCNHAEDSGAKCTSLELYDVRVVNGSSAMEGRVEVYLGGFWETVCDDQWDINDATVVCWQLGFSKAISAPGSAYFGRGSGKTLWTKMDCSGAEDRLEDCNKGHDTSTCTPSDNAGVICGEDKPAEEGSVRLVDGATQYEGRVEIHLNGRWGTVCDTDSDWNNNAANVVCRQLGYGNALSSGKVYTNVGTGAILIDSVVCFGSESRLEYCGYDTSMVRFSCTHQDDVGARCKETPDVPGSGLSTQNIIIIVVSLVSVMGLASLAVVIYVRRMRRRSARHCDHATLIQEEYCHQ